MANSKSAHYCMIIKGADGEHMGSLALGGGPNDQRAMEAAANMVKPPLELISVQRMDRQTYLSKLADFREKHKNRVPIDEKTGGVPNRILNQPELLSDDKD